MDEGEELKMLLARTEMILTESKEVLRDAQMKHHEESEELWKELNKQLKRTQRLIRISEILFWIIMGMGIMELIRLLTK
jgi:hypothetical protein